MNKMKIVKEYYEIKLVLEHLQSLEKTEKRLKRINSKIEDMEELKNEYNELYPKTGIGIPFESALEEYELFEKQKDFTINKSEEGRMYYLQVRRKFEGKTKKEYNYYINSLYSAYKNRKDNSITKGKIELKNSSADLICTTVLMLDDKVINEFFRLSYLDLKYMIDSNKKQENNKTELIQFVGVKGLNDFIYVCKNYSIPLNRENINKDLLEWKNKNNIIKAYWRKYEDFINS